ncbi:MAG: hypothetical protein IPK27_14385 [Rhodanobacteraceae bacterium]|nr:hypothetical protein [Rhodanobacteraceae bacterium]
MLDLPRILAAVTAVTEGRAPAVTVKTAPEQACTAVTEVTAGISKGATDSAEAPQPPTTDHPERLTRVSSFHRNNRNNRTASSDAGSAVTEAETETVTAVTTPAAVVQLVTCETCRHFRPDPINPPAGVGICAAGVAHLSIGRALHPMAPRYCAGHEVAG